MISKVKILGLAAGVLFTAGQTAAAPLTATFAPLYTTTDSPANHVVPGGGFLDGVGDFLINGASSRCSSALLGDGLHVLTAAHCLTDGNGANTFNNGTVRFFGDNGTYTIGVDEVFVHTNWNGNFADGSDIAVMRLNSIVDSEITRYDIYRDADEVGQVGDKAGFGRSGTGATGSTISSGTKRTVQNRYDIAGLSPFSISSDVLMYDFDNGNAANDAIGALAGFLPPSPFVVDPVGVGINEGISAPGDSGGPTFIGNMIAGVTSFGFTYFFGNGSSPDIDGGPGSPVNSTFGEIAGDTRVSSYTGFIDGFLGGQMQGVPVPLSGFLLLTGLIGLARMRHA